MLFELDHCNHDAALASNSVGTAASSRKGTANNEPARAAHRAAAASTAVVPPQATNASPSNITVAFTNPMWSFPKMRRGPFQAMERYNRTKPTWVTPTSINASESAINEP